MGGLDFLNDHLYDSLLVWMCFDPTGLLKWTKTLDWLCHGTLIWCHRQCPVKVSNIVPWKLEYSIDKCDNDGKATYWQL